MRYRLLFLVAILFSSCANNNSDTNDATTINTRQTKVTTPTSDIADASTSDEDIATIRQNFKRINNINSWDKIDSAELWISLEGGQAKYYYKSDVLEKIVTRILGEMGESLEEYYFLDSSISFVYEKEYHYNRPVYYDSNIMKQQDDTEVFDINKSEIIEHRYYFANNKLIRYINSENNTATNDKKRLLQTEAYTLAMVDTLMAKREINSAD